eukprot:TRINITY_DN9973_c0_g1_i1.p4 TRINITY_DN9973_c0_g1~~TRINITY_DN9973_c0_g1_i1.p4  ORF type:complete len:106 (+),score=23.59 TRINITY_DN9973_c0_g1_i1:616-933(+)
MAALLVSTAAALSRPHLKLLRGRTKELTDEPPPRAAKPYRRRWLPVAASSSRGVGGSAGFAKTEAEKHPGIAALAALALKAPVLPDVLAPQRPLLATGAGTGEAP